MKKKRCHIVKMTNEARVIRMLRQEAGFSMSEAGYRIGKSDSFISHLENGRRDFPSIEKVQPLNDLPLFIRLQPSSSNLAQLYSFSATSFYHK